MKTWILIFSLLFVAPCFAGGYTFESLAVQDGGRVKPLLTVAQESLQLIYGRSKYKGQSAIRIFSTWMMVPEVWYEKPIIRLDHLGLKKSLGFAEDQKFFTPKELVEHPRLNVLFADLSGRVAKKEKLDPYYQAVQRLEGQVLTYIGIRQGALKIFPSQDPERQGHWLAVAELPEADRDLFFKMLSDFASTFTSESKEARQQAAMDLQNSVDRFVEKASAGGQYPQATKMLREVHYQTLHPFLWTWIFYLMAAIFVGLSYLFLQKLFYFVGWASALFGFLMHTYGFILRVQITGRPPVANMYETVVWVGWGVALFAGIFTLVRKKKFILLSGSIVATFAMVMADMAPVILDPSLQPLEPVLRSNMWLVIHVMTITLSYAAFFLAFGIGDYGVLLSIKDETANKAKIRELSKTC
ncbi:MAG: cytochrome c biogenesis protein CcsA [Bdellovibrionales bacterium]|nr:cytochrome c biogenesis protein CcsA [Bdellovibrionales bacterium]